MNSRKATALITWFNVAITCVPLAPVLILYFAKVSGSYALAGSVFTVILISSSLFELPTGILSDTWGRQKVMLAGTGSALVGSIWYALGYGYWSLVIGAICMGLCQALFSGNNDALLYEVMAQDGHKQEYGEVYGKMNGYVQISMGASAILGGFIARYSLPLVAWVSIIPFVIGLIIALFIPNIRSHNTTVNNPYTHLKEAITLFIANKRLRLFSLFSIISGGLGESSYQFLPAFYASVVPTWVLGIVNALNKAVVYVSFHFAGKIVKRLGEAKTLVVDFWFDRVVSSIAFAFPSIVSPFLVACSGVFFGPYLVSQSTLFQEEFTDEHRATMGSLNSLGSSIFYGMMTIVLGFIADHISPAKGLLLFQVILIPTFLLLRASLKHHRVTNNG